MAEDNKGSFLDIPKPTTPGDIGAVGLGLAAGYFVALIILDGKAHTDITPGSIAVYVSAATLGIKNSVQAVYGLWHEHRSAEQEDAVSRARNLDAEILKELAIPMPADTWNNASHMRKLLGGQYRQDLLDKMRQRESGLITDEEFKTALSRAVDAWANAIKARKEYENHFNRK